jgi:hypothetical protein
MKNRLSESVDKQYKRFNFPGFGSQGTCFLRARVRSTGVVVLCSQLLDYHGTSVTNAAEQILVAAIDQLQADVGLDHLVAAKPWWRFRDDRSEFIKQIVRRVVWVEHYPEGAGLDPHGSFALVAFDSSLHPVWNYVSKEAAASECGLEKEFFEIEIGLLRYGT